MMQTRNLTVTALFVAIGILSAHLIYFPVLVSKCFPVQHAINILLAVLFGTRYAVGASFLTATMRNLLGTGTLLAYPGSMCGALVSGILYERTHSIWGAIIGEVIGTGIIGAMCAYPLASWVLGSDIGAFFFVIPFMISTVGGSIIAYFLLMTPIATYFRKYRAK